MSESQALPSHVGFIMDGNRRWAQGNGKSTFEGHLEGALKIEPLVRYAEEIKIPYLTFYSFSTENWGRKKEEISEIFKVFDTMLQDPVIDHLQEKGVKINMIGDYQKFPNHIVNRIEEIHETSALNDQVIVNFALNYGGHQDIIQAANRAKAEKNDEELTKEDIEKYLYTAMQPALDLVIRTGGEQRISNFMIWQAAYAELYFTHVLWPNFTPEEFGKALEEFQNRHRRFGK